MEQVQTETIRMDAVSESTDNGAAQFAKVSGGERVITIPIEDNRWKGNWKPGFDGVPIPQVPKCAIIGFAPSSRIMVPWEDQDMCRVGMNDLYHVDRMGGEGLNDRGLSYQVWFQIHHPTELQARWPHNIEWLRKPKPFPIYMIDHYPEYPSSVPYPVQEVIKRTRNYFNNSVSYELAWAYLNSKKFGGPFEEVYLYGVDMAQSGPGFENSEYSAQRPSCEYFVGLLEGAGIPVHIPIQADLLKTGLLYGYESTFNMQAKIRNRIKELHQQKQDLARVHQQKVAEAQQVRDQMVALDGAVADSQHYGHNWTWGQAWQQEWSVPPAEQKEEEA